MARRLLVVAHARAGAATDPVFGDQGGLVPGAEIVPVAGPVKRWVAAPEPACRQSMDRLGGAQPALARALAGPDLGRWNGRTLSAVAAETPDDLRAWLTDPAAAPHGGESLVDTLARVGGYVDEVCWPEGRSVVVVTPAVARLLAIHAVGGTAELGLRLDVRFGGRFELSAAGRGWRLLLG